MQGYVLQSYVKTALFVRNSEQCDLNKLYSKYELQHHSAMHREHNILLRNVKVGIYYQLFSLYRISISIKSLLVKIYTFTQEIKKKNKEN